MRLRPLLVPLGGVLSVLAGLLTFGNLNDNLVYYLTPAEATEQREQFADGRRFRLAGEVAAEGIARRDDEVTFTAVGDGVEVAVVHSGAPPQLFQPGIPVVVEGAWDGSVFRSDTMLIHHDEEYRREDAEQHPDEYDEYDGAPSQGTSRAEVTGVPDGAGDVRALP